MKDKMKEFFIKRMQEDNPGILNDEAGNIFEECYPHFKYMRGAEYDTIQGINNI